MTGTITDCTGRSYELPLLLGWDIQHTLGSPCDSFEVSFLFQNDMLEPLRRAVRFSAEHQGQRVFRGVVDEIEVQAAPDGLTARLSGRGLAALLMDNEAESADYFGADLAFILSRHVLPWGIEDIEMEANPATAEFSVSSGASHWKVLDEFCRMCAGFRPRFTPAGVLLLAETEGRSLELGGSGAVLRQVYRQDRYGVISSVLVKAYSNGAITVDNEAFLRLGGASRRIVNVPKRTGAVAMRYTGEYQIERSAEDFQICELELAEMFAAFPGDRVALTGAPIALEGGYVVAESRCTGDGRGARTALKLRRKVE